MKKISIGFSKPIGFFKPFSWAIRLVEKTPYSHVFVRIHSQSLGLDLIYQASGTQVNFEGDKRFKNSAQVIEEFEFEITDERYVDFLRWAVQEAGAPYSMSSIFGILLVKCFRLKTNPFADGGKTWVCSELGGKILNDFLGIIIQANEIETAGPKYIYELCTKIKGKIDADIR